MPRSSFRDSPKDGVIPLEAAFRPLRVLRNLFESGGGLAGLFCCSCVSLILLSVDIAEASTTRRSSSTISFVRPPAFDLLGRPYAIIKTRWVRKTLFLGWQFATVLRVEKRRKCRSAKMKGDARRDLKVGQYVGISDARVVPRLYLRAVHIVSALGVQPMNVLAFLD